MDKAKKNEYIDNLTQTLADAEIIYLTDTSELPADVTSKLRRECFNNDVTLRVVKNTLLQKAIEKVENKDLSQFSDLLKGQTSLMTATVGNAPAKMIQKFRKKQEKPILKGAFIEESIYIGDNQVDVLSELKSKDELLGEIIGLLQSPIKNVVSSLESGKSTLAGLVKTLSERSE